MSASTQSSTAPGRTAARSRVSAVILRPLIATCVLLSAVAHLFLWADGMRAVDVVGPAFLLNGVGGIILGMLVVGWQHPLPLLGAMAFGAATLGAFIVSTTARGFFGVHETWNGVPQQLSAWSEIGAIVLSAAALVLERRRQF
ncbi:hypothetical protein [Pengzhenrongella sicca]|uniref:Uncharacterized protein n=1 Tax=Pengzhenrongella sicca TaxID=2819238 RepID=A0A8A4ZC72_9MICO|nr:hypothetical protein [Pengzhenrongella sicca]QTE29464.1 hypothetical protein J4E96_19770 [Pengzhenrongella sicca]